jgi:hypothetical protein
LDSIANELMKNAAETISKPLWLTSSTISIIYLFKKRYAISLFFGILTGCSIYVFKKFDHFIIKCKEK